MRFLIKIEEDAFVEIEAADLQKAKELAEQWQGETLSTGKNSKHMKPKKAPRTLYEHILQLVDDEFFVQPKTLTEIRKKLQELAIYYPSSTFPAYLTKLLNERVLRRFRQSKESGGEAWVYVNA